MLSEVTVKKGLDCLVFSIPEKSSLLTILLVSRKPGKPLAVNPFGWVEVGETSVLS